MKQGSVIKTLLFALTAVLLFISAIQQRRQIWSFTPLTGVFVPTPKPKLSLENCRTATYQTQMESYLKENIGFREPLIRFYNQYLFDFFKTSNNENIIVGKDGWLYFIQHVNEYYGKEAYRWHNSAEEAFENFDREARLMWKLRGVLKDYGVDFFVFMAPQKGFLYPEHLPRRDFAEVPISAREYYSTLFDLYGFPYIEMTQWFIDLKKADTLPYSLFPQTGAHWDFSAALATDSLMRFMGNLKGVKLPTLQFGPLHESSDETKSTDYDIESLANLIRPLPHPYDRLLDAEVTFTIDSTTTQPSAIFVGTSFLMRMYRFVPFSEIFPNSQYWYYNSLAYFGKDYKKMTYVNKLDILSELLETDYVVWFTEGDQMCKASFGFVESTLVKLCFSDEQIEERRWQLADSLDVTYEQANELILKDPERYLPELAGDSIPAVRNIRIPEVLAIKEIKKDPKWIVTLRCQAAQQRIPIGDILKAEAQNVLNNKPLMRDNTEVVSRENYVQSLVDDMVEEIRNKPELMAQIQEKANMGGMTLDEQLEADARWIVNDQIQKGEIVLNVFE
jgi:hypothetical protein